jgi:hypothetical protein
MSRELTRVAYAVVVCRISAVCALIFLALASGAVGTTASAVSGPKVIARYCSPSGDVCFGIFNRSGAVYLEISTAARYFRRYTVCVRPPGGPVWGSSLKYARQFPVVGSGTYRVTWKLGARPLGPTLSFRLPLHRSLSNGRSSVSADSTLPRQ